MLGKSNGDISGVPLGIPTSGGGGDSESLLQRCCLLGIGDPGDDVLAYDVVTELWSRIGKLPYGEITSHCGTNTSHIICIGGEPRHAHNSNTETAVQIAEITYAAAA